jgi:hypothetical protein
MPRLDIELRDFVRQTDRLLLLIANLTPLEPRYQKMVCEIGMLRLFSLFEGTTETVAIKVVCGAKYVDGSSPVQLVRCRNSGDAVIHMLRHARRTPLVYLKWTNQRDIRKNIRHVLDPLDNFYTVINNHGPLIDEMRRVRNHIAHRSSGTRREFKPVVVNYYGAYVRSVTPGVLLFSRRWNPPIIEQYIRKARIIIKDLIKV